MNGTYIIIFSAFFVVFILFAFVKRQSPIKDLEVTDVKDNLDEYTIIDVRSKDEYHGELGHIKGSKLIPLEIGFVIEMEKLNKNDKFLFVCRSGMRSRNAAVTMLNKQFPNIYNLKGGMLAWNQNKLPIEN